MTNKVQDSSEMRRELAGVTAALNFTHSMVSSYEWRVLCEDGNIDRLKSRHRRLVKLLTYVPKYLRDEENQA